MSVKKTSLRVLFITSTFPRWEGEELAKWIGELAVRIKRRGVKIDVLAPAFRGSPSHDYFGIPVYRFRYAPGAFEMLTQDEGAIVKMRRNPLLVIIAFLYLLLGSFAVIKFILRNRYDIVHIHWPFPNGIFGVIAKSINRRTRLILSFYGAEFALVKRVPFGKTILSYIIRNSDGIIAISSYTKKKVQDIRNVSVHIIPFTAGFSLKNE